MEPEIKELVLKLRVLELRKVLDSAGCNSKGLKGDLRNKVFELINSNNLTTELKQKLYRLAEDVRIPLRQMNARRELEVDCSDDFGTLPSSPFFANECAILRPIKMRPSDSNDFKIDLNLSKAEIARILDGREKDGSYLYELQLILVKKNLIDQLALSEFTVTVNETLIDEDDKHCSIFYITQFVSFKCPNSNKIKISWLPEAETECFLLVNLVKRLSVDEILKTKPFPQAGDFKHFIINSMQALSSSTLKVSFLCSITSKKIVTPCRSFTCSGVHYFEVKTVLSLMEKRLQVICPECKSKMSHDSLVLDTKFENLLKNAENKACTGIAFTRNSSPQRYIIVEPFTITID